MSDAVMEWVEKAEEDYRVALALRRLRRETPYSALLSLKAFPKADRSLLRGGMLLPRPFAHRPPI